MEQIAAAREIQAQIVNYRQLTQDRSYSASVKSGKVRLERVTHDKRGISKVEPCGPWLSLPDWKQWMAELSI